MLVVYVDNPLQSYNPFLTPDLLNTYTKQHLSSRFRI